MIFLELDPSTGFQILPDLLHESAPVLDAYGNGSTVDEVEFLRIHPLAGYVIYDEFNITGYNVGLDGAEVCSGDLAFWVAVGELYSPGTCAATNVQTRGNILRDGCQIEPA